MSEYQNGSWLTLILLEILKNLKTLEEMTQST